MLEIFEKQLERCNFYKEKDCPKCQQYKDCLLNLPPNEKLDQIHKEIETKQAQINMKNQKIRDIKDLKVDIESKIHNETIIDRIRYDIKELNNDLSSLRKDEFRIIKQLRIKRDRKNKKY